jgi:hypothetical protein
MCSRLSPARALPQQFVASGERSEELVVQVVRSVMTTTVGFSIAGSRTTLPA